MNVVLLGPPGAGKGTQAKVLEKKFGLLHVSTGDILRSAVKNGTEIGKKAKSYMTRGELVPDLIVIDLVKERISKDDGKNGFLLDGFPRTERQAEELDRALKEMKRSVDKVLYFKTSPSVSVKRLSGRRVCKVCGANFHLVNMPPKRQGICDYCDGALIQRNDDTEATINNRLRVYESETGPLIGYYKKEGTLEEVNGDLDVDELFRNIRKFFSEKK